MDFKTETRFGQMLHIKVDIRPCDRNADTLVVQTAGGDRGQYGDLLYMIDFEIGAYELALGRALQEIGKQIERRSEK